MRLTLASLTWLTSVSITSLVIAQAPPPPPPPPPDAGEPAPAQPEPAQPAPAQPSPAGPDTPPASSGEQPAGPAFGPAGSAEFGADVDGELKRPYEGSVAADAASDMDRRYKLQSLQIHNSLSGSTGLLRVRDAGSGSPGSFRLDLKGGFFSGGGFLCNADAPCPDLETGAPSTAEDDADRVAADVTISATPLPFLEAFLGFHNSAASNDRGAPSLLQVLGDTNLGVKAFTPKVPDSVFSFGGELELLLLNGTGGVGLDGSGTSFGMRGLASVDLDNRINPDDRLPIRAHVNLGYLFNNSAAVVQDLEETPPPQGRGERINRVERFGLNIDRVDSFEFGLGAEYVHEYVRPFIEWTIDVPVNRQSHVCNLDDAALVGDLCLGEEAGFSTTPSRLSVGARVFPWTEHGLAGLLAFDVGTGATSRFIEEVAPELPWQFWIGVSYAVDTVPPEPVIQRVEVAQETGARGPERTIEGVVVDAKTQQPIDSAVVRYDQSHLTGMVTDDKGVFRTRDLSPGVYVFNITADGYRPGQCTATIPGSPDPAPGPSALGPDHPPASGQPVDPTTGQPLGPAATGATSTASPAAAAPPEGRPGADAPVVVNVQCDLKPLPRVGDVLGTLVDGETGAAIPNAKVKITDNLDRELELVADQTGAFQFKNVPEGKASLSISAADYLPTVVEIDIKTHDQVRPVIRLHKVPERPNVVVTQREVKLLKQIHFQHDSAEILAESQAIVSELAQLLKEKPDIRRVEVQGHTDDTGQARYNLMLSQQRAEAVVAALIRLGIKPSRMAARGYGAERPLLPNVSDANRAKNRRVQVMILEKD